MNDTTLDLQFIVSDDEVFGLVLSFIRDGQMPRALGHGFDSLDDMHRWIPDTHIKASAPVEAPILEVWIDARVAP